MRLKKIILLECLFIGIFILSSCARTEGDTALENNEPEGTEISGETEVTEEPVISEVPIITEIPEISREPETDAENESGDDTLQGSDSDKESLEDLNIHPLYAAFLRGEISVANPYASKEDAIPEFSFFFEQNEEYGNTFENATKSFSFVDVNGDGGEELIFAIDDGHDHIQFIFGILNDELICYDVFETHTHYIGFDVYDNGNAWWGQNYDGRESVYYTYDGDGNPIELIHFVREYNSDSGLRYDYYYLDGDEEAKVYFSSDEEYEELDSAYAGNILQWYQCGSFADIPEW